MADYYLQLDKPQAALNILMESEPHKPFAVPYLRLKAEAYLALNQAVKAYETISQCQQLANDMWRTTEQDVFNRIQNRLK